MFLGIDCGTQGTKALLIDERGKTCGRGYAPHSLKLNERGGREQEPVWWVDAMVQAVREAVRQSGDGKTVRALAVSGQQHGLVVLDSDYQVIRPAKLWNDTETAAANDELIRRMGGKAAYLKQVGIIPLTGYTASKLLWIAQNEPDNFQRIRHILLPHEYLNFWLTGKLRAEFGDASGTGYFDVRARVWVREVLDAIDGGTGQLFAALPELMQPDEVLGELTESAAQALELSSRCIVSAGGGDNMMAAIGTGNVREGLLTLSLGTSSTVYSFQSQAVSESTGCVAPFCSSTGGWLPLVCTMNATNVVTGTAELVGKTIANIDEALDTTPVGADGLVFLPFLNGERTPDLPNARGSIHGIDPINFTPLHLIRAAVEGVTFGILNGLDLLPKEAPMDSILLIGGGARSRGWRQLVADSSGIMVKVPVEKESGCLGAAIQAFVVFSASKGEPVSFEEAALRFVQHDEAAICLPNPAARAAYDSARRRYRAVLGDRLRAENPEPEGIDGVV